METLIKTEQNTIQNQLESLAADEDIHSLISDIAEARFGEPINYDLGDIKQMQKAMQTVFNFRPAGGERSEQTELPQKELFAERIHSMAEKVGLAGDTVPENPQAQAAIVLGGAGKSPLDRTLYTEELLDKGLLQTDTIVLLGSSRPVNQAEIDRGGNYAVGARDEYELMKNAAVEAFGVEFDDNDELQGYEDSVPAGFEAGWKIAHAQSQDGRNIFVLSAPVLTEPFYPDGSRRPRANTADTYKDFAKVAQFEPGSHVVAVTNAHFRPFQGADAVAELNNYGISAEVVGYDPSHFGNPEKKPEELAQETLSAVNSMMRAVSK